MTLEQDLVAWVATRPEWQRDAVARFCRNESLSTDDLATVADHLIAGTYPSVPAISETDVPGSSVDGVPVTLSAISGVIGVNALVAEQELTFGDSGLTVIYGDNASGKSGYARLIRQAVTARVKAELLGDVFAKEEPEQAATFSFNVDGNRTEWVLGATASKDLSSVRFYDEECGDAYVTSASEISYRPSALTILDRLSKTCDALQRELSRRLADNAQARPELPMLTEGTPAKVFLSSLTARTTMEEIDAATQLDPSHQEVLATKLREEARLRGSDPTKEQDRLKGLADRWDVVRSHIDRLTKVLSSEAIGQIRTQRTLALDLRAAATVASAKDFDAEPLAGVGSGAWRALWEAARQYSEVAYHEHDFPLVGEQAVCVLCQQPLSPDGAGRLTRFEEFVTDTTSRDADAAERQVSALGDQLAQLQTVPTHVSSALNMLQAAGEDVAEVDAWLAAATGVAGESVVWLNGTASKLPAGLIDSFEQKIIARRQELEAASAAIDSSTFDQALRALSSEVATLQAQSQLTSAKDHLVQEVDRLVARAKIEDARRLVDTTGITRKATDLTTEHVTSVVRDQFTRETERLHLRKVTLDPTGGRRSVTLEHRPKLLGATLSANIDSVLSEGEQTALGLAGFLTEVMLDDSKSAVVLDDPVSSLDAGRRSRVAVRLVELAQDRQVIVFTHEATFVTALNKAARDQGVPVVERSIIRQGHQPGKAIDKHPWNVKDTRGRIDELTSELARLRKEREQLDSDEYTKRAQEWGGRLSQAWERAVNLDVVNELVDRGTNEVRPRMFRMLVEITADDNTDYQSGYAKASEWAPRHDQAPEVNFVAPEPDELEGELKRFVEWVGRIKKYKK